MKTFWHSLIQYTQEALTPLRPLAAQVLWILQPTLSLWWPWETIAGWANTLEAPPSPTEEQR